MRSIVSELKARQGHIENELHRAQKRVNDLTEVSKALRLLLAEEERRLQSEQLPLMSFRENKSTSVGKTLLSQIIFDSLADGKPKARKDLEAIAKAGGVDFENKNPMRVLHFALIGLQHNGYTVMTQPGVWQLTEKGVKAVAGSGKAPIVKEEGGREIARVASPTDSRGASGTPAKPL